MIGWLDALNETTRAGEPSVLITVVEARGSTPREAGSKMLVTRTGQFDTIGGGNLEHVCIAAAREALAGTSGPALRAFPLGPALGQCCGGHATVLFEPMRPPEPHVAIFGAGHVGLALASILSGLPMRTTLIDSRQETLTGAPDGVRVLASSDPAGEVAALPQGSFVLIMTHDHSLDFDIVAGALARSDLAFVGLIGSATKRARFISRLHRLGLPAARIARLTCPIGLPGTGGKRPAEIAVSVAAQLLQLQSAAPSARQAEMPAERCTGCVPSCLEMTA